MDELDLAGEFGYDIVLVRLREAHVQQHIRPLSLCLAVTLDVVWAFLSVSGFGLLSLGLVWVGISSLSLSLGAKAKDQPPLVGLVNLSYDEGSPGTSPCPPWGAFSRK